MSQKSDTQQVFEALLNDGRFDFVNGYESRGQAALYAIADLIAGWRSAKEGGWVPTGETLANDVDVVIERLRDFRGLIVNRPSLVDPIVPPPPGFNESGDPVTPEAQQAATRADLRALSNAPNNRDFRIFHKDSAGLLWACDKGPGYCLGVTIEEFGAENLTDEEKVTVGLMRPVFNPKTREEQLYVASGGEAPEPLDDPESTSNK